MSTKSVLLRIFSLLIQSYLNFDITYSLSRGKKRGVKNFFFSVLDKKFFSLKCQIWPDFSLKMVENFSLKLNNFLPIQNGKFGNPAFFSSAQAI